jgi:hypothetical protein
MTHKAMYNAPTGRKMKETPPPSIMITMEKVTIEMSHTISLMTIVFSLLYPRATFLLGTP